MENDIKTLKEQAKSGNYDSAFKLSEIYDEKGEYRKGFYYLMLAAKGDNRDAYYSLGMRYKKGETEERDYKKAFHYFTLASNLGLVKAAIEIGHLYEIGIEIPKSYEKALEIYKKYSSDNSDAQLSIGRFYEEGILLDSDIVMAEYWYRRAIDSDANNFAAKLALKLLKPEGIKEEITNQERIIKKEKKAKVKYIILSIIFFIICLTIIGCLIALFPLITCTENCSKASQRIKKAKAQINKLNIKLKVTQS